MRTNAAGIALIQRWEGKRLKAYPDPATGGEPWTIGYGHTTAAGTPGVKRGMTITDQQATDILKTDLAKFEAVVSKALTKTPTPNQFAAMCSLCFNVGGDNFSKSSVVRKFNAGDTAGAASSFLLWNKAVGKVMAGLTRRREDERKLFLTP